MFAIAHARVRMLLVQTELVAPIRKFLSVRGKGGGGSVWETPGGLCDET